MEKEEQEKYLEFIAREKRAEKERAERAEFDRKYNPAEMDCERMPFGCWAIIGIVAFFATPAIFGLLMKLFRVL